MYLLGIDEAGRAPLAGPVAVGFVRVPEGFDVAREFPGVKDSKQLSEGKREEIFHAVLDRAASGDITFCVRYGSHDLIDERGITIAVKQAIRSGVRTIAKDAPGIHIKLDGALYAPREYSQETIVHGDDLEPVISLASIVAKVSRDRLMRRFARKYPEYGFDKHKGYPTSVHYEALRVYGPCEIHRRSYLHLEQSV